MIRVDVRDETMDAIDAYARIPSAFLVDRVLRIRADEQEPSRWHFTEERHQEPFIKDYDAIANNHPTDWPGQFDTASWRVFAAFAGERRVGGAIVIPSSSGSHSASDAQVSEVLDLRVHPDWQRQGIASALWTHVVAAATTPLLRVETQHYNVAACAFYAAQGCTLALVEPSAYPTHPDEVRLIWQKAIVSPRRR